MVCTPQLCRHEDILSLDPSRKSFLEAFSNLVFVAITIGYYELAGSSNGDLYASGVGIIPQSICL